MRAEASVTPLPETDRYIGYFHCSGEPEPAELTFRRGHPLWLLHRILFADVFLRALKQMNMSDNGAGLREPFLQACRVSTADKRIC